MRESDVIPCGVHLKSTIVEIRCFYYLSFKGVEFDTFEIEATSNKFKISPQKLIKETNTIEIISKSSNL